MGICGKHHVKQLTRKIKVSTTNAKPGALGQLLKRRNQLTGAERQAAGIVAAELAKQAPGTSWRATKRLHSGQTKRKEPAK